MSMFHSWSAGITFFIVFSLTAPASGKSFMKKAATQEEVEASLLAELAGTFRASATKDHIMTLETALKPMYTAVPQEADGTLRHTVVRYILHRFFAQRGWFIRGLEPGGNATSGSDSLQNLQEWVPTFLQGFLEQLAGGRGISLRELAILAATLEDLVHKETINRLEQAFHALGFPLSEKLDDAQEREVLEVFMMIYMLGGNFTVSGTAAVRRAHNIFVQKVKDWNEVQEWTHNRMLQIYPSASSTSLDFDAMGRVVEDIGANYATYNKKECSSLKSQLLEVESQKAGRVRLADFYKKGLTGVFEFNEKIDYLRVIGALDESEANEPHVIVPNYVSSRSNCLAASSFYVVCCRNECEDLMGKLENAIAGEMATPEQIIQLVSALSSDSVQAPRKLSTSLTKRLQSIADNYGGEVPLHGRLFAQWMHHAFPRECPFPHEEGSVNPQTPDEWMQETGQETSKASTEEMMAHVLKRETNKPVGAEARKQHHYEENELPWSEAEELLLPIRTKVGAKQHGPLYKLAVMLLVVSVGSGLVWASKPLMTGQDMAKSAKSLPKGGQDSAAFISAACKMA